METNDEKILKENLKKSADSFKAQLEAEVDNSLDQLEKILKISAIVAGGVFVGYSVFKIFFKDGMEEENLTESNNYRRSFGASILQPVLKSGAEIAAMYLLTIAKRKLIEYIKDLDKNYPTSNGYSARNN